MKPNNIAVVKKDQWKDTVYLQIGYCNALLLFYNNYWSTKIFFMFLSTWIWISNRNADPEGHEIRIQYGPNPKHLKLPLEIK